MQPSFATAAWPDFRPTKVKGRVGMRGHDYHVHVAVLADLP